jgi:hypothetical protein
VSRIELLSVGDDGRAASGPIYDDFGFCLESVSGESIVHARLAKFGYRASRSGTMVTRSFYVPMWLLDEGHPTRYAVRLAAERCGWPPPRS